MERIIIDDVAPEGIGDELKGCYFKPRHDDTYDFYDSDGKLKKEDVTLNVPFSFDLDGVPGVDWSMTVKFIDKLRVDGNWTDKIKADEVGEPEGTFQGQAGGGLAVENAASASGN